jgi:hypothetical protein
MKQTIASPHKFLCGLHTINIYIYIYNNIYVYKYINKYIYMYMYKYI